MTRKVDELGIWRRETVTTTVKIGTISTERTAAQARAAMATARDLWQTARQSIEARVGELLAEVGLPRLPGIYLSRDGINFEPVPPDHEQKPGEQLVLWPHFRVEPLSRLDFGIQLVHAARWLQTTNEGDYGAGERLDAALRFADAYWTFIAEMSGVASHALRGMKNYSKLTENRIRGNDQRHAESVVEQSRWQREADEIWSRRPDLTNSAVAKLIDQSRWDSIRKLIKKKAG